MDPFEQKALDFLVELTRIIRNMQMYNNAHPIVRQGITQAHKMLSEVLRQQPSLSFGKGEGVLLVQNKQITEKNPAADRFIQMLGERNIGGVIIRQGVPISEVESFIQLMATKPDSVVVDGQIKPELLKGFQKISVNEIKYLMVGDGEDLESLTEARKFFTTIFSEEFKGLKGTEALQKIGSIIQKALPKLAEMNFENGQEELWEFFEKSVASFGGTSIRDTRQGLVTTIKSMPEDIQKVLFGQTIRSPQQLEAVLKKFSDDRKAAILMEEATADGGNVNKALEALLKSRGELVQVAEALMKKFGDPASGDKGGDFDKIFQLIQKAELGDKASAIPERGLAFISDPKEEAVTEYQELCKKLGFRVEAIVSGRELLTKIRTAKEKPNLVIMDVKLPELSALEILRALDMERIRVPIILCTDMLSVKKSFEVAMYPKIKFFAKPFDMGEMINAINEFCPPPQLEEKKAPAAEPAAGGKHAEPALSEEMKAEMNKAREIQRNLMPRQFPQTPGYELHAFYKPYDEIGGDYYDVIAIGPDHVGMLIADVSGHGISGAMVMVMVRSAIRAWAHTTTSPKELLAKVNPIIARDILPGLFVTVYYFVLDMPNRKITASCAGHNPAILWKCKERACSFTKKGGMPLGIMAGKAFETTLREEVIPMEQGDRIILYTDGMVETMDPSGEEFTEERFCAEVNKCAMQRSDVCVKHLVQAVVTHQSTAPQHDDLTLATLRCLK